MIERQDQELSFDSPYRHGFVRAAVATPGVRVAAPAFIGRQTLDLAREASAAHAAIVVFPELGLSAYSNDDPSTLAPAHRENLRLSVEIVAGPQKSRAAGRRIRGLRRPGIIYCVTTTAVDQLAGALRRAGIPVVRTVATSRRGW
jgi:hypothetical protein